MPTYIHQQAWPSFTWDMDEIGERLAAVRHRQGLLAGRMEGVGLGRRAHAALETLAKDVLKSSEIEGEILDQEQVRSSLARRLGLDGGGLKPVDRNVEGVVEMTLDATERFREPLSAERLFGWHAALFPTGYSGLEKIVVGAWRDDRSGPMQVVSGPVGRQRVHYEAPAAKLIPREMEAFFRWFNDDLRIDPVLKAALAHLWFVTIHPFEDGNGRIARAIADMALARSEDSPQRFYSMSAQIRLQRKGYYDCLEATQKGDLDITRWMLWFLDCLERAILSSEQTLATVFAKARFWAVNAEARLNARQQLVVNRLLDGFEGKLTTSKWAVIAKCSQDTALRDIEDLMAQGLMAKDPAGGRSTSYSLRVPD